MSEQSENQNELNAMQTKLHSALEKGGLTHEKSN